MLQHEEREETSVSPTLAARVRLTPSELAQAVADFGAANWASAAEAIMTTDTVAKAASRKVRLSSGETVVTGIAKGAGMIRPDMATMLGFVATDAKVSSSWLKKTARVAADRSFNCITVDGDTSTNDSFIVMATGRGPAASSRKDLLLRRRSIHDRTRH